MTYALDSNVVTYVLKGDAEIKQRMEDTTAAGHHLTIPHIVYFEVRRWLLEIGAQSKLATFEQLLCNDIPLEPLDKATWDVASALYVKRRKEGKPLEDADLLIAAFAIVNEYTLVTNNARHFAGIKNLQYVNWKQ